MLKLVLRRIHLILAFASGLFLINLSISGALLVYGKEIQSFINPQYWSLSKSEFETAPRRLTLAELIAKIEQQTDEKIQFIQQEDDRLLPWQVRLVNTNYLSVNPYTGEVLLSYQYTDTFYGFIMSWHRWLIYTDERGEKPMQFWVAIASLILIIEILVGTILWLRPKHRIKRLKVRWKAKNKIWITQLHGTLGVFFGLPLLLIAFSGIGFFWQDATKQVVQWFSFSEVEQHNFKPPVLTANITLQLDKAYETASAALPAGQVFRVYPPQNSERPLALRIKMPSETHAYSWSWANPYTGQLLHAYDASKASIATKVWHFKYKFHIGEFIGWPVRVLWLFICLLPCFFIFSGLYLWLKRKSAKV